MGKSGRSSGSSPIIGPKPPGRQPSGQPQSLAGQPPRKASGLQKAISGRLGTTPAEGRPRTPKSPATGTRRTPATGAGASTTARTLVMKREEAPPRAYRPGISLSIKFSLIISGLVVLVALSWGMAMVGITRTSLLEQILRQGVNTVKVLAALGSAALELYDMDPGKVRAVDLQSVAFLQPTSNVQSDVLEAAVYFPADKSLLFSLRGLTGIGHGNESLPPLMTDVQINPRTATIDGQKYSCISFEVPVKVRGVDRAMAMLLLNASKVKQQVNSIVSRVALIGVVFALFGVALSFLLASMVTHPIKQLASDMVVVSRGSLDHYTKVSGGDEIGLLASSFNQMVLSLRTAREMEKESERLQSELNAAREIQANLLPEKTPEIPGYDFRPYYHSAKEVGGDYYDIFPLDYDHLVIVVADVSGKGIPGSMEMARTRTILRIVAPESASAAEAVIRTNALLAKEIKRGMFVTLYFTILQLSTRQMTCVSAGHNAMYVYRAATGDVEAINPNGIALGFDPGPIFERTLREKTVQLYQGDRFVLYTDGVVEAMSPQHEEFGDERLISIIKSAPQATSRDLVNMIVGAVQQHQAEAEQHDDITIVTGRVM